MNTINTGISSTPQFKGIILTPAQRRFKRQETYIISNILSQKSETIKSLTRFSGIKKLNFLRNLTDKYNQTNFFLPREQREDSLCVNRIYNAVKRPTPTHFSLVSRFKGSTQALERIFTQTKSSRKKVNFAERVNNEIINGDKNVNQNLIAELLESENSKEYINNYNNYRSYLILNKHNNNAVQYLDNMLSQGSYDQNEYDKLLNKQNIISKFLFEGTETFNEQTFYDNYTTYGNNLLNTINANCYISKDTFAAGTDKDLLEIFQSTTKENYNIRQFVASNMLMRSNNEPKDKTQKSHDIAELNKLFKRIDQDKEAKEFTKKLIQEGMPMLQLQQINAILDNIPAFKLNIFFHNAKRIMCAVPEKDQVATLQKELENTFFETQGQKISRENDEKYGYSRPESILHKVKKALVNQINILHYNFIKNKHPETPAAIHMPEVEVQNNKTVIATDIPKTETLQQGTASEPVVNTTAAKPTVLEASADSAIQTNPVAESITEPVVNTTAAEPTVLEASADSAIQTNSGAENITEPVVTDAQPVKLDVKQSIFEIIKSKLGKTTLEKQKDIFNTNATKIRLSVLPEIFASITDTRKTDRAVGKYRINSSNKDALELFLLTNGNNKKYINYLLKKRNVDNTRMFEVKEIIAMIRKAEAKIAEQKKNNPEYRARDARRYYNHLYEAKIEQYGKVRRQKVRTKA